MATLQMETSLKTRAAWPELRICLSCIRQLGGERIRKCVFSFLADDAVSATSKQFMEGQHF